MISHCVNLALVASMLLVGMPLSIRAESPSK